MEGATVRQAQQTLGGAIMVLLLVPMLAARWLPAAWKHNLSSSAVSPAQLAILGLLAFVVLDAGVVALTIFRFKRGRLIAE